MKAKILKNKIARIPNTKFPDYEFTAINDELKMRLYLYENTPKFLIKGGTAIKFRFDKLTLGYIIFKQHEGLQAIKDYLQGKEEKSDEK